MKKYIVAVMVISFCTTTFFCTESNNPKAIATVKEKYNRYILVFNQSIDTLQNTVEANSDEAQLQQAFKNARNAYKCVEVFAEYYNPSTAEAINGPALDEVELDNPEYPFPPSGFQVIEELLFPQFVAGNRKELVHHTAALRAAAARLTMVNEALVFTNEHVFDAVRLQLFRMATLGISGFDTPVALSSISEIPFVLYSLKNYLTAYHADHDTIFVKLANLFDSAAVYAASNDDFNTFNRAVFMTNFLNPLTKQLNIFQETSGIRYFNEPRPLASNAATLFEKNIFNPSFYTGTRKDSSTGAMVALGKRLFNEQKLSANNLRSCASCHIEAKAFTDGIKKNKSFDGASVIMRNTPTILYASLQPALFADSRLSFLEDQARQVIENPNEMHGNLDVAANELLKDTAYQQAFQSAFSSGDITAQNIQKAIASYIRTKNKFSSRFDAYMRGDFTKMNRDEIIGFNLFMGKAKCGTCHFMPLFNGNVPPVYLKIESEVLGVPSENSQPYHLDKDSGKYKLTRSQPYLHSFKTTTVRNTALTAPFMHNGVFATLEEVMDFYNKGGGIGLGIPVKNQTLPEDKLNLTATEQKQLIAFIHALTDESY